MILTLIVALFLGFIAGIIDIFPLMKRNIPKASIVLIFTQWVMISLIIPFLNFGLDAWLTGVVAGIAGMIPIMAMSWHVKREAIIGILIWAIILGAGLGFLQEVLLNFLLR